MTPLTPRQQHWLDAADRSDEPAATLFRMIAMPNEAERGHVCFAADHRGFRTAEGRRGIRCGICRTVIRWVDAPVDKEEASR
jgi:hypothetical protein